MNKIPLEILALSSSVTQSQSYAVVLGEVDGLRRIPIVIGSYEAQSIAVALEQIKPARPLTHDLLNNMMNAFEIVLEETVIYKLLEGIFYAKLVCTRNGETLEIDSRTSDAIAISIRAGCPIYTYENILNEATASVSDEEETPDSFGTAQKSETSSKKPSASGGTSTLDHYNVEELKAMMQKALDNEDYDLAIKLRDELNARGEKE